MQTTSLPLGWPDPRTGTIKPILLIPSILSINDMYQMQMLMNHMSQLSEMSSRR